LIFKIAETIGQTAMFVQEEMSSEEIDMWAAYFSYKHDLEMQAIKKSRGK